VVPPADESPLVADAARWDVSLRDWALRHQHEVMHTTTWMGVQIRKNPLDAWVCQELLHRVRPDVVVEIGSYVGGSTLYFAHVLDLLGHGEVISVDISRDQYDVDHPRVVEVTGSSADSAVVEEVARRSSGRRAFVIHDGDHRRDAVLGDLRAYGDLVSVGSYFVVEDGIVDLYPVGSALHPAKLAEGPLRAVEAFLAEDDRFEIDAHCERYGLTWNPAGFLRRVK
jgi:cephalosporin hydroxylase